MAVIVYQNKENAGGEEAESAKPGSDDTAAKTSCKTEPAASVPEVQVSEASPSTESASQPGEQAQESTPATETIQEPEQTPEEQTPAGNEPETAGDEKQDQQQETAPAEETKDPVPPEEVKSAEDNVDSEPASDQQDEVQDTTQTAPDSSDVSAPAEDTPATTTANGPIDEVQAIIVMGIGDRGAGGARAPPPLKFGTNIFRPIITGM